MTNLSPAKGQKYGVEHLLASFTGELEEILQKQLELSASQARFLRQFGSIYVNDRRCLDNQQIETGTYIRVHQKPRRFPVDLFDLQKSVIFENEDLIVVNKPSGLPVPATVDNFQENMASLISQALGKAVFVTHRLDIGTSGLLIFAKSKASQSSMNQKFMNGEVQKFYRALVHGTHLPRGEWKHYMEPSPRAPKHVSREPQSGWATCRLQILDQTEVFHGHSEVIIELLTGRTHQIRSQLSSEGFPIVGDHAYGSPVKLAEHEQISLQAFYLNFSLDDGSLLALRLDQSPWAPGAKMAPPQKHS